MPRHQVTLCLAVRAVMPQHAGCSTVRLPNDARPSEWLIPDDDRKDPARGRLPTSRSAHEGIGSDIDGPFASLRK